MPVSRPNSHSPSLYRAILRTIFWAACFAGSPFHLSYAAQVPDPSHLAVTPSTASMILSEEVSFSVVDGTGRPLTSVQWSINPPLAELRVENGEATVTAKQPGRATLTATTGNETASANLTIVAGPSLPPATVRWSVEPTPGFATLLVRQAVPNPDSEVAFYAIEWNQSSNAVLRAFQDSGQQLWMTRLSSSATPLTSKQILPPPGEVFLNDQRISDHTQIIIGDKSAFAANNSTDPNSYGLPPDGKSILLRTSGDGSGGIFLLERGRFRDSIVDVSSTNGSESWRYTSKGRLAKNWSVNHQGDVAIVETISSPVSSALLILNGTTGEVRFRIAFPISSSTINGFRCQDPVHNVLKSVRPSLSGSVFTSTDSNMYIQVELHVESLDIEACKNRQYSFDDGLSLLRVTPEGETEWREFQHIHSDGDGNFVVQERVFAGESIPDGFGGVLAAWTYFFPGAKGGEKPHTQARLSRIGPTGQRDFNLPMPFWSPGINSLFDENMILGEGNPLYATNGTLLVRFDTEAGEVNWVRNPPTGSIKLDHATPGGGLVVVNAGRLHYFDAKGNGMDIPWTAAVSNPEDIGLAQSDPFEGAPLAPLQLRDVQLSWAGGKLIAVEDGQPYGRGAVLMITGR